MKMNMMEKTILIILRKIPTAKMLLRPWFSGREKIFDKTIGFFDGFVFSVLCNEFCFFGQ